MLKKIKDCSIEFISIDKSIFKDFKMDMGYLSLATFYRFLIPSISPKGIDRALYLDGDMIITQPLDDLFSTDFQGKKAAVVEEKNALQAKNLKLKSKKYFNAGMMLLNLKEINKDTLLKDAFDYYNKHQAIIVSHDQDILNGMWDGCLKFIDQKYNVPTFVKNFKNPVIIHYTGFMKKPWAYFAKHPHNNEWIKYNQMTPYKKTSFELFIFRLKRLCSKAFLFIKDPTHKKYYVIHFLGIKFGLGTKDNKER